ncbi:MAG: hydantoinase/oxoprolinase family protein [Acidimicrobiales bacterium]
MTASAGPGEVRVGIDVGGTFTDVVVVSERGLQIIKVPSTPSDQSTGVMAALAQAAVPARELALVSHGTTVATNALLERRGAATAIVTTEGFRDVIEIARQARPALYDLVAASPPPLVPRERRFSVRERVGPRGEVLALDEVSLAAAVEDVRRSGAEAVAVCFLFSFLDPDHERRAGQALRRALPEVQVSTSSEVLPEFREYERFATTTADAYLGPSLKHYLVHLGERLAEEGFSSPLVMQSSGGVLGLQGAVERPSACLLSGPAAGVVGAAYAACCSGFRDLLTFDMGGTSTDVALVAGGRVQSTTNAVVGGIPIKHAMVDVHTIGAGGGSVVWSDPGGALRAGPRSAGAQPGPACYGLDGGLPTVTDANLLLGYLADGACLGGQIVLDRDKAERALRAVGAGLGLSALETAVGAIKVTEAEIVRALRVISVDRGTDPRELTLVAFGGAGPLHACSLAAQLEMPTVIVPRAAGVLSALGLAVSDLRKDYVAAFFADLANLDRAALERAFRQLEERARTDLREPQLRRQADLRYRGQSFELTVPANDMDALKAQFSTTHKQRYGFELASEEVQIVNIRLTGSVPATVPELRSPRGHNVPASRASRARLAYVRGEWCDVAIYARDDVADGEALKGPAIVEFPESTCVVQPGWRAFVDQVGALVLERQ